MSRNVKESGSKRLSLCPSALFRKVRYSDGVSDGLGTLSDGELNTPDSHQNHLQNHQNQNTIQSHDPVTTPTLHPSTQNKIQAKLCGKCSAAVSTLSNSPRNHQVNVSNSPQITLNNSPRHHQVRHQITLSNSPRYHQVHLIQPPSNSVTTFLEQHQSVNGGSLPNGSKATGRDLSDQNFIVNGDGSSLTERTSTEGGGGGGGEGVPSHHPCILNGNGSVRIPDASSLIESRKVTSYQQLKLSFFTEDSPTHSQPPTITIRMKPDGQGRFGFNVKVS